MEMTRKVWTLDIVGDPDQVEITEIVEFVQNIIGVGLVVVRQP